MNLSLYKYSKTEIEQLLKSIVILIDTREKQNKHITEFFGKYTINYKSSTLPYGDYSFYLPENKELGIDRDTYFNKHIAIERKGSLEELSGNLAQQRDRFENELLRAGNCRLMLMIENSQLEDILSHKYNTQLNERAFLGSLLTFNHRFNTHICFIDRQHAGQYIYMNFYYYLREFMKGCA